EIEKGRFREDLFYRISVVPIHVQPLRARREDIPLLIQHFMARLGQEHGRSMRRISPEAIEALTKYSWPGNVRELKNLVERLLIMSEGESIGAREVEAALPAGAEEEEPVSEIRAARDRAERDAILAT